MVPDINKAKRDKGIKTQLCARTLYYFLFVHIWEDIVSITSRKQNILSSLPHLCLPRESVLSHVHFTFFRGEMVLQRLLLPSSLDLLSQSLYMAYMWTECPSIKAEGERHFQPGITIIAALGFLYPVSNIKLLPLPEENIYVFHGLFLLVSKGHLSSLSSLLLFSLLNLYWAFTV